MQAQHRDSPPKKAQIVSSVNQKEKGKSWHKITVETLV